MFKKLRIRLTLFNLLIISTIIALMASFAFIGSQRKKINTPTQEMLDTALNGGVDENESRSMSQLHVGEGGLVYILVKDGKITARSSQIALKSEDFARLATIVATQQNSSGTITDGAGNEYTYLRMILDPTKGETIVLQQVVSVWVSLVAFLSRIGFILLGCIALVFLASLSITQRALVPIKKAWEKQIEFTADASHELRTPLAVIQTNLEAAMDEPKATIQDKKRWLKNIEAETNSMTRLVDDLLTLSRGDSNQKTLEHEVFSLDEALLEAIIPMLPYAKTAGMEVHIDIAKDISFVGDRGRIKQLVVLLVDNAIKYSGGTDIMISAGKLGKHVEIIVSDNGEGIAKEDLDKLFDRFYRADKARTRECGGSGLGLSIAKWIAEEHGGKITVVSNPQNGTSFKVIFS